MAEQDEWVDDEWVDDDAPSGLSRFIEGVKQNANPITILSGIGNALMHPMKTLEGMEQQSDQNFAEAEQFWEDGDYGRAIHRGIAGAIPPYNIVTQAADAVREGNVAGGLGQATGAVLAAKSPGVIKATVPPVVRGANRVVGAGAQALENNPALGAIAGAGVGYAQGGLSGALTGAMGGGLVPRLIRALTPDAPPPPAAPPTTQWGQRSAPVHGTRPLGPAQSVNETGIPHGPAAPAGVIDTRLMHGPAPNMVGPSSPVPPRLLTAGARPMPPGPDPSYVRSVPAKYGEPMNPEVLPPLPPSPSPGVVAKAKPAATPIPPAGVTLPKMTKVDVARIVALDKELGATSAARALRHDPRFAKMSVSQRTEAVRAISSETPHTLPAAAAREIDAKFAAVEPAKRLSYVASWADVNPAVYHYLQQKLVGK